jgi:K319L-like, PKD domain
MRGVAPGHNRGASFRRAVTRLLIATLVCPAPLASAAPSPIAAASSADVPPAPSCAESLSSGAFPTASTAQSELWPANHALVDVGLRVDAGPLCLGLASRRVAVYSDEPDDATGDGSTIHDAQLDPGDLYLRSERQGTGDGRIYLIVATATHSGATGRACTAVVVPISQSKKDRDASRAQASAAVQACEASAPPAGFSLLVEGALDVVNQAPIVDAGPDQGIELGGAAELNGSIADDGRPTPGALTVSWSAVSGPGLVTFTDSTQPRTQARFGAPGTYLLRLTASDGALSSFDDVQVVVNAANLAPVVGAGPDLTITLPATTTALEGSVVDDGRLLASPAWRGRRSAVRTAWSSPSRRAPRRR